MLQSEMKNADIVVAETETEAGVVDTAACMAAAVVVDDEKK